MNPQQERQAELRDSVGHCLWEALLQVCGGNLTDNDEVAQVKESCRGSISFPNKTSASTTGGKPHDMEVRLALSLFHRWKQQQLPSANDNIITITSDMGLQRQVASPADLAALLIPPLEASLCREGIAHNVQCHPSGFIGIVTAPRAQLLRQSGKLPCPHCPKWCQGTKGLWWHQQQCHNVEHSEAASVATSSMDTLAIIPYNNVHSQWIKETVRDKLEPKKSFATDNIDDPLEMIKAGDLPGLQQAVTVHRYQAASHMDHRGASPLMWAAGSGNLDIVRYLIEHCGCDPSQPQKGKRSFSGRTALHWAARKGHLAVVQYLVNDCENVNVEAATTDGTTAFGWASWQGHRSVMEFLATQGGCDIHRINSFGCNAVLWCAQGQNGDVDAMKWLQSRGCHMTQVNHNGHGVLHKAAQRRQAAVCQWFWDTIVVAATRDKEGVQTSLRLVGPDAEGYCPSDLAGMEGHEELAQTLANWEMDWITTISSSSDLDNSLLPAWLTKDPDGISVRMSADKELWEPLGGVRRMKSRLVR